MLAIVFFQFTKMFTTEEFCPMPTVEDLWPPKRYNYESADNKVIIKIPLVIILSIIIIITPGCGERNDPSV